MALDQYDHYQPSLEQLEVTETKDLTEINQGESEGVSIQDKTGARNLLVGRWRIMKWRLLPGSQIDKGVGMTVFFKENF